MALTDNLILPAAERLLFFLCQALEEVHEEEFRPLNCCLRVGESVSADASTYEDICCEGLGWVRVNQMFASNNEFPNPDTAEVISCAIYAWGVILEMGVIRCAPTGDIDTIPTCAEWTQLSINVANDALAMRKAMQCFIEEQNANFDNRSVAVGSWDPLPTSGGCAGGTWDITVQIINDCEGC